VNLCELINEIKERDGLTWRQLTQRAVDRGAPPPTGLFHLGNPDRPMQDFPRTKTIIGVAAALGVDPKVVAAAALESLNLAPRNVVEVAAKSASLQTGDVNSDLQGQTGDRWIVLTPEDETPDEALKALQNATKLRVVVRADDESSS
jgi:hypothetical protein